MIDFRPSVDRSREAGRQLHKLKRRDIHAILCAVDGTTVSEKVRQMGEMVMEQVGPDGCQSDVQSAENPDWSREAKQFFQWYPSRSLLSAIRSYQSARGPLAPIVRRIAIERHRFWSIITGADIPIRSNIAGGLILPHPNGVVIAPDAIIGPNCLLFQQVTIGTTRHGYPKLGGGVDVGAGARILGPITIGDNAKIGANAVVVTDIPAGATAIGVPARIVSQKP